MAKQRGGIVEEVLTPLLRQLATAEHLLQKSPTTTSLLDPILDKITRHVKDMKWIFRYSDEKEKEVIHSFEAVSQLVDDLLQSTTPAVAGCVSVSNPPSADNAEIPHQQNPSSAHQVFDGMSHNTTSKGEVEASDLSRDDIQLETEFQEIITHTRNRNTAKEVMIENSSDPLIGGTSGVSNEPVPLVAGEASEANQQVNQTIQSEDETVDRAKQFQKKLRQIDEEITRIMKSLEDVPLWRAKGESSSQQSQSATLEDKAALDKEQEIQWEKVFKESEAMSHLGLRIESLDNQLKGCLFCFTMFEENEVISKRLLIHWWIGEGLVASAENGGTRIKELVSKRLIEPTYSKWTLDPKLEIVGCKMYPWIYRLLVLAPTRKAYFSPSCRLCLFETNKVLSSTDSNQEQLLTLYNIRNRYLRFDRDWFKGKKSIGVIQLGRWQSLPKYHIEVESTDFLQEFEQCTSLKYLSFRGISRIDKLPESIGKLTNLIILDLRACHNLEKLTTAITSLKKLMHLDVSECYLLEDMPAGLGNLSELQVMKGFVIGNARRKKSCRLTELAKLMKLQKLSINIGRDSVLADDEIDTLENFKALKSLTIRWGVVVSRKVKNFKKQLKRSETMHKICNSPPPKLEKLDLRCYPKENFYEWMTPGKLGSLKKLYVRGGNLVSLGNDTDWKVEVLRLKCLKRLKLGREGLQKAFPSLAHLEVSKCAQITSFEGVWTEGNISWSRQNGL